MNSKDTRRRQRAEAIFHLAVDCPESERRAILDEQCGSDLSLRREVESLLRPTSTDLASLLSTHALGIEAEDSPPEEPEASIADYRVVRVINEGGMGVVYLAEQLAPIRRTVALKVIRHGMDTEDFLARFESERQTLALLDHPCVAKVFDAGTARDGRPFFALEFVDGMNVIEHCDHHRLSIDDRLGLFMKICEAVQHAHQKGIIHRDIKPANVLVTSTEDGNLPKVIDFGVAKAVCPQLQPESRPTLQGQLLGTPEYMSPEQASTTLGDVDTRTDIYSLGVLLYELLVGGLPLEGPELLKARFELTSSPTRPNKPSVRWESTQQPEILAGNRSTDPRRLKQRLRGDLDWITMKALEEDRESRYATASDLAADIHRHLHDEPIVASPPHPMTALKKFARRNRAAVVAGFAITVILISATAISIRFALREARSAENAQTAQQIAERREKETSAAHDRLKTVVDYQATMMAVDPEVMGREILESLRQVVRSAQDGAVLVESLEAILGHVNATDLAGSLVEESILAKASATIDRSLADQPLEEATLRQTLGETYRRLGLYERARNELSLAVKIRRRELGHRHEDTLSSIHALGGVLRVMNRFEESLAMAEEALEGRLAILGAHHEDTLSSMTQVGSIWHSAGKLKKAESALREALAQRRIHLGADHRDTITSVQMLGILLRSMGRFEESLLYVREALMARRRLFGDDDRSTLVSINTMGYLLSLMGERGESLRYFREALTRRRRVLGDLHPRTLDSMSQLGVTLTEMGLYAEARPFLEEALESRRRVRGEHHVHTASSMSEMGLLLQLTGEFDQAESILVDARATLRDKVGDDHPRTIDVTHNLARLRASTGRLEEAESLFRESSQRYRSALGEGHPTTLESIHRFAALLAERGRLTDALTLSQEAVEGAQSLPDMHELRAAIWSGHGRLLVELGEYADARAWLLKAHDLVAMRFGDAHRDAATIAECLKSLDEEWQARSPETYRERGSSGEAGGA